MSSFADQIKAFAEKTQIRADRLVRKVVLDVTSDLVRMTPVDTGHARSNWFFGFQPNASVDPAAVKSGAPSIQRALEFSKDLRAGGVFYISNNVEYILALEYGHSKQAPAGMVRVTVSRWQGIVDRMAREASR